MDTIPQKRCTACQRILPATPEYFHRDKTQKYGLSFKCKTCKCKKQKAYLSNPDTHQRAIDNHKEYMRRPDIRERTRIQGIEYRQRPGHNEHRSETRRAHYPVIRDRVLEQNKTYYHRPEVQSRYRAYGANRRARKRAVSGSYTPQQIHELLKRQKHRCYYCSCTFEKKKGKYIYHIDHTFPLNRVMGTDIPGNDISYIVLACPTCNLKKSDKFPWEWPEGGRLL